MDGYLSHFNAFEDIVFPYDMASSLSFFDLSTDIIDQVVKTEPETGDSMMATEEAGQGFSAMDYASFVMGELQELDQPNHDSEPDFATSIASDSPYPHLNTPNPTPNSPAAPAAATELDTHFKYLSDESESDMTNFSDIPLAHLCPAQLTGALPSTPPPPSGQNDYLPSPPITPLNKRTVKKGSQSQVDTMMEWGTSMAHPTGSPVATVKSSTPSHGKVARPRARVVTKTGRSKTPATAKLSIRRKLAQSHALPKRRAPVKTKATPSISIPTPPAKKLNSTKVKVKTEASDLSAILNAHPFLHSTPTSLSRAKSGKPKVSRLKKPSTIGATLGKGRSKGRTTNNSLSTTLHPPITKRKGRRTVGRVPGPGKICSSYYPSDRKLVPHSAGHRYHKGAPGTCAREDCVGDSKATVNRHCISEYMQKGARGSSIPRPHRLYWCNKCYMRHRADSDYYPRLFSMILDQLEHIASIGDGANELFHVEFMRSHHVVNLEKAKEYVVEYWRKYEREGSMGRFKVRPVRF